ncbi:low choriolytic enzyme-like [Maniola hyperantus]|uniref:low choriolytic enzyme-like n=1 Tax=Aphantopus hyperantus TaxID=2795564 RepID=UPI001567F145|nr:low choriolytic enzyme-like [Maniola hyperantus]
MKGVGVLFFFIGLAACGPPVTRTREEIFKLKEALERSRIDDGVLFNARMLSNPDASIWENSGKYQGDILLDDSQLEDLVADYAGAGSNPGNRNAFVVANTKWPGNVMIWQFGVNEFNSAQQQAILTAMSWIEHFSCVRFRRRTNERVVVTIRGQGTGCYAHVGFSTQWPDRVNNLARNTPGRGCFNHVVIIHELLHNLGFQHMHQTFERNDFVRINWNNIDRSYWFAFDQFPRNQVNLLGLPYEYTSSMHYGAFAFSINRQPTITATRSHSGAMGQREHATHWDWLRLRRHYNCPGAWNERNIQRMKEEVDRTLPLIKMNLPAPKKGLFTDEDNAYVQALASKVNEDSASEDMVNEDFTNQENENVEEVIAED